MSDTIRACKGIGRGERHSASAHHWKVSLPTAKAAQIACILDACPYKNKHTSLKQFHVITLLLTLHPDPCPHLPGTTLAAGADYDDDIL